MTPKPYDVLIAGGGIMGCCTAYYLTLMDPSLRVGVVERDPAYTRASSSLSMANVRIQFSLKQNIQISQFAMKVLSTFGQDMEVDGDRPEPAFHQEGNLFLYREEDLAEARQAYELQKELGCAIEWWDPDRIHQVYPLYNLDGYVGGAFGPDDGHIDAYAVMMGYKAKARVQGVQFIKDEVAEVLVAGKRVVGLRLGSGEKLACGRVVNCAGAWAADLAKTAGVNIPVSPVKRQVFALDVKVKPEGPLPLTVLPSGLYFRTETGGLILLGKSLDEDPVGYDFNYDRDRFMDLLWLELAEFVPAWDTLKLVRGWAGLYAVNTLDGNAILGEWPELQGFYLANGFSGHGLQQGPAVGRYLSELILGRPNALDLSVFHPIRILENRPIGEHGLV